MSTIYTINGKVLKNVTTGKWLAKKEAEPVPAGFVMNASNVAGSYATHILWEGPDYPNGWNGEGKTIRLIVSEDITLPYDSFRIGYGRTNTDQQEFLPLVDWQYPTNGVLSAGTYTYTGQANQAASYGFGAYIALNNVNSSDVSKITIQIVDP